jgi:hypothetical protein
MIPTPRPRFCGGPNGGGGGGNRRSNTGKENTWRGALAKPLASKAKPLAKTAVSEAKRPLQRRLLQKIRGHYAIIYSRPNQSEASIQGEPLGVVSRGSHGNERS